MAHQYGDVVPNYFDKLRQILTKDEWAILHGMFHYVPSEEMENLVSEFGLEVVSRDVIVHKSTFKGIVEYAQWMDAAFHGQIPFSKRIDKTFNNVDLTIHENGTISKRTPLVRITFRKPEL